MSRPIAWLYHAVRWLTRSRRNRRRLVLAAVAIALPSAVVADLALEHRHLPWRPLDMNAAPGLATGFKMRLLTLGPETWCDDALARADALRTRALPPRAEADRCGWDDGVRLIASGSITLRGKAVYPMRCALAAGAHRFLTGADRQARALLGSPLTRIHHAGTYACRRMYNRSGGRMSEHAFANAWDVTGFELADGRVVSVLDHWGQSGPAGRFLRAVRDEACRVFNVVLGPDYNAAHRDHFHFDMGGGARCR